MSLSRRDALKRLGAILGGAGAGRLLSGCSAPPGGDAAPGIDTYVFVMLENRSYDHYLGSRALFGEGGDGLQADMSNPDSLGADVSIFPAGHEPPDLCIGDPPHSWDASRLQLNGGRNDGFVRAYEACHGAGATECMQYMTREHIPVTHALADAYTSCDRWFSSVLGPTLPNRMYWHAGTSNGATRNGQIAEDGAMKGVPTVHHRLDEAGVPWAYYYADAPVLAFLDDLPFEGRVRRFYYDFLDDAAAGNLPPVSFVDPAFSSNDDHPPHHPLLGQMFLSAVYQALATSPQWERCLLVITYDEHGGFFDHVPPPTAPDDHAAAGFDQLGFRVPALVVGPYVKTGHVSSTVREHTSVIRHLENAFGLSPLTARSSAAADLMDCLDADRLARGEPSAPIALPFVEIDEASLPPICRGTSFGPPAAADHDILAWAEANKARLGTWYRPGEVREATYGIAAYLETQGLGCIRRP